MNQKKDDLKIDISTEYKVKKVDNKIDLLELWLDYYAGEGEGKIGVLNLFSNYKENGCIFYPFSKGIPWKISENDSIEQNLNINILQNLLSQYNKKIKKGNARKYTSNKINIVMPGFLPECLIGVQFYNVLKSKGLDVFSWLTPSWYKGAMEFVGLPVNEDPFSEFDYFTDDKDIFQGFDRLSSLERDYCSPIFFDLEDNLYFNLLYNYKEYKHYSGLYTTAKNENVFWKNILKNCCCDYQTSKFNVNKNISDKKIKEIFDIYKIDIEKKYMILDMSNICHPYHNSEIKENYMFSPKQIEEILYILNKQNIQLIISTEKEKFNTLYGSNLINIPKWYEFNSYDLCCLIYYSTGVISADPNLYLTAAILGVENICVTTEQEIGKSINDTFDISMAGYSMKSRSWIEYIPNKNSNLNIKPFFLLNK